MPSVPCIQLAVRILSILIDAWLPQFVLLYRPQCRILLVSTLVRWLHVWDPKCFLHALSCTLTRIKSYPRFFASRRLSCRLCFASATLQRGYRPTCNAGRCHSKPDRHFSTSESYFGVSQTEANTVNEVELTFGEGPVSLFVSFLKAASSKY